MDTSARDLIDVGADKGLIIMPSSCYLKGLCKGIVHLIAEA